MKNRNSGAEAGAGSRTPRSLLRLAMLAVLLLILAFLVWVLACVPPAEAPRAGIPEPEPAQTPALIRLPLSLQSGETAAPQAGTPEPEGTPTLETGEPAGAPVPSVHALSMVSGSETSLASSACAALRNGTSRELSR